MKLTKIQKNKVEEIISYYNNDNRVSVEFQSPTGSGKTFMAASIISELIYRNPNEKFIFIIATLSSSELPKAFENKINMYKKYLTYNKFNVEHIASPSTSKEDRTEATVRLLPEKNKIYIFGKATFGNKRIFTERNVINDFIEDSVNQDYKVVYIRDEAHHGAKLRNEKSLRDFENLMSEYSDFTLHMTATLKAQPNVKQVILSESDLNNEDLNGDTWLLKTQPEVLLKEDISDDELLIDGLKNFKKIQEEYKLLEYEGISIKPALLIQVSDEPTDKNKKKEFFAALNKVEKTLENMGFAYLKYFGSNDAHTNSIDERNTDLNYIANLDNEIDVVIFKVGPATGWDIPRACMLLQLRNVSSQTLNTQTIGRIKRNPYPNLKKNDTTDKFYIYSNAPASRDISIYKYKVKDRLKSQRFARIKIVNKNYLKENIVSSEISKDILTYLEENKNHIAQAINTEFINVNGVPSFRKIRQTSNGVQIYSDIINPFDFLKELKQLKQRRSRLFKIIESPIKEFYLKYIKDSDVLTIPPQLEFLQYVILQYHEVNIKSLIQSKTKFIPEYKFELIEYRPEDYVRIFNGEPKDKLDAGISKELLFDISKNNEGTLTMPLDSKAEPVALKRILHSLAGIESKVQVWAKNMTTSSLYGEYLDDENNVRKSYFDFILKFKNNTFLYIEVKSDPDISEGKTKMLAKSYNDYFQNKEGSLINDNLIISICKVDKNGNILTDTYYDKELIQKDLSSLSLKQLIETISNL